MLVEVTMALALLGVIGVSFLSSAATTSTSRTIADEKASAKMLAEGIMDNIKKQDFAASYNITVPDEYAAFSVNLTIEPIRTEDMQLITVQITHWGDEVFTLEGYKVTR